MTKLGYKHAVLAYSFFLRNFTFCNNFELIYNNFESLCTYLTFQKQILPFAALGHEPWNPNVEP